jgi:hypothetical protein
MVRSGMSYNYIAVYMRSVCLLATFFFAACMLCSNACTFNTWTLYSVRVANTAWCMHVYLLLLCCNNPCTVFNMCGIQMPANHTILGQVMTVHVPFLDTMEKQNKSWMEEESY